MNLASAAETLDDGIIGAKAVASRATMAGRHALGVFASFGKGSWCRRSDVSAMCGASQRVGVIARGNWQRVSV